VIKRLVSSLCVVAFWIFARAAAFADYQGAVLSDSPLAYFRLQEASGTVMTNLGSYAGQGVFSNTNKVAFGITGPLEVDNRAVSLSPGGWLAVNGSSSLVHDNHDFTVEAWVRPRTNGMVNILSFRDAFQVNDYQFYLNSGNKMNVWNGTAGANISSQTVSYNTDGSAWYHLVWTRSNNVLRSYFNGAQVGSDVSNGASFSSPGASYSYRMGTAGADGFETQFLNGDVDELAFYDYALSSARVLSHFAIPEPSTLALAGLGAASLLTACLPRRRGAP
jgi:hypothetical protein